MAILVMIATIVGSWFIGYVFSSYVLQPIQKNYRMSKLFSQNASHELKTPVSVLKATIDVMRNDGIPDIYVNKINMMEESVNQMRSLIESLTLMTKNFDYYDRKKLFCYYVKGSHDNYLEQSDR
jgi:OmpR-family two-component system manganese-sensing sensor histidine kinase